MKYFQILYENMINIIFLIIYGYNIIINSNIMPSYLSDDKLTPKFDKS